jgi:hypothetical protein
MKSHAANPVAEHREGDVFRVYFGSRDAENRTSITYAEIEISERPKVVAVADQPLVTPGERGLFDDSGASLGCVVTVGQARYLYYLGWNLGVTVPWRNSIGLAVSHGPGQPFRKYSPAPLLDRCSVDPYSISYPWVLQDENCFRMWYGSNLQWGAAQADMHHVLKYAESRDGIHWQREGQVAIGLDGPDEYALCRPSVIKENGLYRMWYCHRGDAYRMGYAESSDGVHWQRRDEQAGIAPSASGWDSEMLAYPCVFRHRDRLWMLYNGNRYGRDGFGLAVEA